MGQQCGGNLTEEVLQLHHMMQALVGHDTVVTPRQVQAIEISLDKAKLADKSCRLRKLPPTRKHACVEINAFDGEICQSNGTQTQRQTHFGVAIAAADTEQGRC
ncbi:MAG: hypothetical protein BWZ07_02962 [Alphaproteobacteria bacterium ADurb.BinA280]|nr:MAG: hypothetical protein BWZ07_02962 [Alphaproteobacteria bacterium ADurb.BinA280]